MNQNTTVNWVQDQPYTAMLRDYSRAADRLLLRMAALRTELRQLQQCKKYTRESADKQKSLEHRVDLLRSEYYDLTLCIREIGIYAAKEQA